MIPEILIGCQKSREMFSVDWNCMQGILGRRSPIRNDPSCYKSKQNNRAGDFQREQPNWIFGVSVMHSVSSRLTINIQQVGRVLQWPNEYRRSGAAAYGSCSTQTSCARDRAHLLRLAPAILRQPQRASGSFVE